MIWHGLFNIGLDSQRRDETPKLVVPPDLIIVQCGIKQLGVKRAQAMVYAGS